MRSNPFLLALYHQRGDCDIPPTLEDKKQTDNQNQNILQKAPLNRCNFHLSREVLINVTFCHALLRYDELYYRFDQSGVAVSKATNAAINEGSLFFRPSTLTLLAPPPHGHFGFPQFYSHQETKMAPRQRSTISRKNR